MRNIFSLIRNKCVQYSHRIFYSCTVNNNVLWYDNLFTSLSNLDEFASNKFKSYPNHITMVSRNLLLKSIVFIYCLITNTKLLMISPKFSMAEIINAILSRRNLNILFIDGSILFKMNIVCEEESINMKSFFNCIKLTNDILNDVILLDKPNTDITKIKTLFLKGKRTEAFQDIERYVTILSPGTVQESCVTNVKYSTIAKAMLAMSHFMGIKPSDKVSVIADFEFFPGVYTILGLLTGAHFVLPDYDYALVNAEELNKHLGTSVHKPSVVIISSDNFRRVWDSIILDVYSNRFLFTLSKFYLLAFIPNLFILKKLRLTFGKSVKKVHILNEELGFNVLEILAKSKLMISSSYGFLEQGNFLAFKDPELFRNKEYIYKPGGTLLKDNPEIFDKTFVDAISNKLGEIFVDVNNTTIRSQDIGAILPNIKSQGDRKFLYVYSKKPRFISVEQPSLDLVERTIKDSILIKDCFIKPLLTKEGYVYNIYIEPRIDLLDIKHIGWKELNNTIAVLIQDFNKTTTMKLKDYGILEFHGMRNVAGKLQHYLL